MAVTIDGYIAKTDGDSDWVSPTDAENFDQVMHEYGCIIVGRKTFDQFQGDLYPVEGILNVVVTNTTDLKNESAGVYFIKPSAEDIVRLIMEKGHEKALLIGGGTVNGLFAKAGLIDELIVSFHPLAFVKGIHLFEGIETDMKLKLVSSEALKDGVVRAKYSVVSREK
jgi:dihydrofolate reductase